MVIEQLQQEFIDYNSLLAEFVKERNAENKLPKAWFENMRNEILVSKTKIELLMKLIGERHE